MNKNKTIRSAIIPGNSTSLWKAVRIAKEVDVRDLPNTIYENRVEINSDALKLVK